MKKVLYRWIALVTIICIFACFGQAARADTVPPNAGDVEGFFELDCGDWGNLSWSFYSNGELDISGSGAMDNFASSSTSAWRIYKEDIISIVIAPGVTSIGTSAFQSFKSLTSVSIPLSVTSIGAAAFCDCSSLTDVYYKGTPEQWAAVSIGNTNDPLLNADIHLDFSGTWGDLSWAIDKNGLLTISGSGAMNNLELPSSAWEEFKDQITAVEIRNGVTSIGNNAFQSCANLTSVTIPSSVTYIGDCAFSGCGRLESVTIPSDVTNIGYDAFAFCSSLTDITVPSSVTSITSGMFYGCRGLERITIPTGATSIGDCAFYECSNLASVTIPSSVTGIGWAAFYGCGSLTDVHFKGSQAQWTAIGIDDTNAPLLNATVYFDSWGNMGWSLDTDGKLIISGSGAMDDFASTSTSAWRIYKEDITSIVIEPGVTSIGSYAFNGCVNLTDVQMPTSVTSLGSYAFSGCTNLDSIWIPSTVTSFQSACFSNCPNLTIHAIDGSAANQYAVANGIPYCPPEPPVRPDDYIVSYNGNGGTGAPANQTKTHGITLTLSSTTPTHADSSSSYTVTLDANGGSVSPTSLNAVRTTSYSFKNWNTAANGSGTSYSPGASYTADAFVTLYAQWDSSTTKAVVDLPTPTRDGYGFKGWGMSADASSGVTGSYSPSRNVTLYAIWEPTNTYTVSYDANGGTGAPANQTGTQGTALTLSSAKPTRTSSSAGSYTVTLNANGGTVSQSSLTAARTTNYSFKNWNTGVNGSGTSYTPGASYTANADLTLYAQWNSSTTTAAVDLPTPTRINYSFKGWGTSSSATSGVTGSYTPGGNVTLYAIWEPITTYTVTYNGNGGTGTPSQQIKEENVPLKLSSYTPSKTYIIKYNATGGSISPASKSVSCTFKEWNTSITGSGTAYAPGATYTANASVTLHAQWTNPMAGALATPTRSGYNFVGWFTSASGGTRVCESTVVTGNMTVFAHWTDPYNMGDETYSFKNYGDSDAPGGHCFGMSMTSAGYHLGLLDIGIIGGNANTPLYGFSGTNTVKAPICRYQAIQGDYQRNAIVAGGSAYLFGTNNIASDWPAVVRYVRNHEYDNNGLLQIAFRGKYTYESEIRTGGHAINFLRYENVNGQDRIYAYDNNFPTQETYFYRDSSGKVLQEPRQSFDISIDCIAIRDCTTYFALVPDFDGTHALYMAKDAAAVQGYTGSFMDGYLSGEEYVMYEIPSDQDRVVIIPNRDYADFIYMDTEYSFGEITDETRGELKFASMDDHGGTTEPIFRIFEVDPEFGEPDFTLPSALTKIDAYAFEGIKATCVYVQDSCLSIGAYAFRNADITQIRIPSGCLIASTAFDGCAKVTIFGTPGSAAETFCTRHENCTFVSEKK